MYDIPGEDKENIVVESEMALPTNPQDHCPNSYAPLCTIEPQKVPQELPQYIPIFLGDHDVNNHLSF